MARIEAIAAVRQGDRSWIAAVAFISAGSSTVDVTSASSESTARAWVIDKAKSIGISEADIQFKPSEMEG